MAVGFRNLPRPTQPAIDCEPELMKRSTVPVHYLPVLYQFHFMATGE